MHLQISSQAQSPLYRRIADAICAAVVRGEVVPGEKLPPHLGLARSLKVSPLTVSRGYEYLESQGIVRQRRGSGTYVEPDALARLATRGSRSFEHLFIVLGETTLAACLRETFFIVSHKLDGIHSVISPRQTAITFVRSLNRQDLPCVGEQDAILLMSARQVDVAYADELRQRRVPMVIVGNDQIAKVAPCVQYDRVQAARLACQHLVQLGHRRIGFIGRVSYPHFPVSQKYAAFLSVLHESRLDVCARHVREADVTPGRAYAAARDILEGGDLPQAFFVDTDYKAMEVISALNDAGLGVPADIAVVGYDDVPESEQFVPPLTTVHTPRHEMGLTAARMLTQWPADGSTPADVTLPPRLIVRQSCGALPQADAVAHATCSQP